MFDVWLLFVVLVCFCWYLLLPPSHSVSYTSNLQNHKLPSTQTILTSLASSLLYLDLSLCSTFSLSLHSLLSVISVVGKHSCLSLSIYFYMYPPFSVSVFSRVLSIFLHSMRHSLSSSVFLFSLYLSFTTVCLSLSLFSVARHFMLEEALLSFVLFLYILSVFFSLSYFCSVPGIMLSASRLTQRTVSQLTRRQHRNFSQGNGYGAGPSTPPAPSRMLVSIIPCCVGMVIGYVAVNQGPKASAAKFMQQQKESNQAK